ncbi:phage head-stabilizing protein [Escherichia coli]|nr:phage head-stabilizing protein [Escherichia coli]
MVTVAELQALRQARLDLLTGKRVGVCPERWSQN